MTRKQILKHLDVPPTLEQYELFKSSLGTDTDIDPWFQGVVRSIRNWQPNTKLLVIIGPEAIGKTYFFEELLPNDLRRAFGYAACVDEIVLYDRMIVDIPMRERVLKYIKEYNFKVELPVDKRMCSYCTTWNGVWKWPARKNVIVAKTEKIDWFLYNSIDKLELWREIFKKF